MSEVIISNGAIRIDGVPTQIISNHSLFSRLPGTVGGPDRQGEDDGA